MKSVLSFLLLPLLLPACGDAGPAPDMQPAADTRTVVRVAVSGLSQDLQALRLTATLGDLHAQKVEEWKGDLSLLKLRLPPGSRGLLRLRAEADDGTCVLARGYAQAMIDGSGAAVDLPLALSRPSFGLCACDAGGFCLENERVTKQPLRALWGGGAGNIWAVGGHGTVVHYDGQRWLPVSSGSDSDLYSLWGVSDKELWAVGAKGTILHYKDGAFSTVASGTGGTIGLNGVWGNFATDVWAVGGSGTILHYNGSAWSPVPSGTTADLSGVWGTGVNNAWAVGPNVILHFTDGKWSLEKDMVGYLSGISGRDGQLLWAVGDRIWERDVSAWNEVMHPGNTSLNAVWGDGIGLFAVGNRGQRGTVLSDWKEVLSTRFFPSGVWGSRFDDVWIVGDSGFIAHGSSKGFSTVNGDFDVGLSVFGGSGPDDVWAAGAGLEHFDGKEWSVLWRASSHGGGIADLWVGGRGDVWVVGDHFTSLVGGGNGGIGHFDGSKWSAPAEIPDRVLRLIGGGGAADLWAVGTAVYHYDGKAWTPVDGTPLLQAAALWASGPADLWAAGAGGLIYHYDGTAWSKRDAGTTSDLNSVWGSGSADVWFAGAGGTVLHFDGTAVVKVDPKSGRNFVRVAGSGPRDLWLLADDNSLLHFDGAGFTAVPARDNQGGGLWVAPSGDAWLSGLNGGVLRRRL